jgi:hypothetical protein
VVNCAEFIYIQECLSIFHPVEGISEQKHLYKCTTTHLKITISPLDGTNDSCVTRYAYSKKFAISNNYISPYYIQVGLHGILQIRKSHVQLHYHHLVNVAKHCIMECGLDYEYLYRPVGSSDQKLTGNESSGSIKC